MNEYLVKKLKEGRLNKGLKQSDVTKLTDIKNTTLSNYENGITEPDIDTFLQLCELYELDFVSIIEEAYGIRVPFKDFSIKPSEIELIEKYRDLDLHGKEMVNIVLEKEYDRSKMQNKTSNVTPMIIKESTEPITDAANPRDDIEVTDEMKQHDNAFFDED